MKSIMGLGVLVVFAWFTYRYPYTMINPGELVEGHQQLSKKCLSCHDPFSGIPNLKCISCHKLIDIGKDSSRVPDSFNKKKRILFHQALSEQQCTACHSDHKGIKPDVSHNIFRHDLLAGTLVNNCKGCHDKPADQIHIDFGDNCDKCHTTSKWAPSTFNHSSYFQLDQNHDAKCNICHINNNFSRYTCYGCHEHSQNSIIEKHKEHGLVSFNFCATCHKSGNEHDIIMNGGGEDGIDQKGDSESSEPHPDHELN